MATYKITQEHYLTGYLNIEAEFEPSKYLYCDDVWELRSELENDMSKVEINIGDLDVEEGDGFDVQIPDEFLEEWKKLKTEERVQDFEGKTFEELSEYIDENCLYVEIDESMTMPEIINKIVEEEINNEQ